MGDEEDWDDEAREFDRRGLENAEEAEETSNGLPEDEEEEGEDEEDIKIVGEIVDGGVFAGAGCRGVNDSLGETWLDVFKIDGMILAPNTADDGVEVVAARANGLSLEVICMDRGLALSTVGGADDVLGLDSNEEARCSTGCANEALGRGRVVAEGECDGECDDMDAVMMEGDEERKEREGKTDSEDRLRDIRRG
jgi:hypothetical protein